MRNVLLLVLALIQCGCATSRLAWQERRFLYQSVAYYSEMAWACDAVLDAQPPEDQTLFHVSIEDSRLPHIITDLNPKGVWIGDGLSIYFDDDDGSFLISWGPDETKTNVWKLQAVARGSIETVYAIKR